MQILEARSITHDFGFRPIFEGLDLVLEEGGKLGLVGANGSGKTTLIRFLAGLETPQEGTVTLSRPVKTFCLAQEPSFPTGMTVYQALESALSELALLKTEYEDLTALQGKDPLSRAAQQTRAQRLHNLLDSGDGWDLRPRIAEMITRLRLPPPGTVLDSQSGGIIKRTALAQALLSEPELLFLDEPTNHLDTETVVWLEKTLRDFKHTLVLITHDRYFLEAVAGQITEIFCGRLKFYPGNYTAYLEAKQKEWDLIERSDLRRKKLLAREIAWLKRGTRARTTKQKARIERIGKLVRAPRIQREKQVELSFDPRQRTGRTILQAHSLCKSFEDRCLIRDFSVELLGGDRIGIIGPNGCGKTTLIRMLVGQLQPDSGHVHAGVNTRIAYFDQQREQLDPETTIWDTVVPGGDHVLVSSQKLHKKAFLESFLFPSGIQRFKVKLLSGGERNRLLLARLMLSGANVLVLDEPTNDLDLPTLQVLEEKLKEFTGSAIVVTHDRYFLDRVVEEIYAFEDQGLVRHYPGNYSYYLGCRQKEKAARSMPRPAAAKPPPARKHALHYLEKKELESMEERISLAETALAELRRFMENPALATDAAALAESYAKVRKEEVVVEKLYRRWDELERKCRGEES